MSVSDFALFVWELEPSKMIKNSQLGDPDRFDGFWRILEAVRYGSVSLQR